MSRSTSLAYVLLLLTALFWSGNVLVARAVTDVLTPLQLAFGRWLVAFVVLSPWAFARAWRCRAELWAQRGRVLALALVGIAGYNTLLYTGLQWTTATHAALLNSFIPIVTVAASAIFWRQTLSIFQALGLMISLMGVFIILSQGQFDYLLSFMFNRGDLWVLGAIICWALYTLWIYDLNKNIDGLGLLWVLIFLGLVILFPLLIIEVLTRDFVPVLDFSRAQVGAFLYVGVFPSVLAYLFYHFGIKHLGSSRASLCIHWMPVFTPLLAWAFLGEALYFYHLVGILLIFSGLYFTTRKH